MPEGHLRFFSSLRTAIFMEQICGSGNCLPLLTDLGSAISCSPKSFCSPLHSKPVISGHIISHLFLISTGYRYFRLKTVHLTVPPPVGPACLSFLRFFRIYILRSCSSALDEGVVAAPLTGLLFLCFSQRFPESCQ